MDDSTRAVLEDLKAIFGPKKILSPGEVGPVLGKSEGVLANLRYQKKSPLPVVQLGGSVGYSIYHLAELLAHGKVLSASPVEELAEEQPAPPPRQTPKRGRPRSQKKYDHLFAWMQAAEQRRLEAQMEIELLRSIERTFKDVDLPQAPSSPKEGL
jgi:hypothetical protein